jgi:hypothetical protein
MRKERKERKTGLMSRTSRTIPPLAKLESRFLEAILPVRAIVTLTTLRPMSRDGLDDAFSQWIQALQRHHRITLGWVRAIEDSPQRHIHAVLIAAIPLDCAHAAVLWQAMVARAYAEAAIVEPYKNGLCGIGYVLKRLGSSNEESRFSDNIAAFVQPSGKSRFPTNAAQRRQRRRIGTQFEQTSCSGSELIV